jgi:hypothetical protein
MADETNVTQTDDRKIEFLLKVNSDRVIGLESALERNWIAHLILAAVGLGLVLPIGNLRELLANYYMHGSYNQTAVATGFLVILLYYFMKLGHLLTLYVEANDLQQTLLMDYLGEDLDLSKVIITKSTNFFVEAFFSIKSFKARDTFWPYLVVTTTVVSLAQAAAVFLLAQACKLNRWFPCVVLATGTAVIIYIVSVKSAKVSRFVQVLSTCLLIAIVLATFGFSAYCRWSSLILLLASAIVFLLYFLFWYSNQNFRQTNLAVESSPALAVVWLIIFTATSPDIGLR